MNPTECYWWIKNPQAVKPKTRMPNLELTDEDARAITAYLGALHAEPPSASDFGTQQTALTREE